MKETKFSNVKNYVDEFQNCESLIMRSYNTKVENRFFIFLPLLAIIFVLWGIYFDSIILFVLGTVLLIIFALFLKYPLARIPLYILDLLTKIRYAGDIAYDIKDRKIKIRNKLKQEYGSYIESQIAKDNVNPVPILEAKEIIDHY